MYTLEHYVISDSLPFVVIKYTDKSNSGQTGLILAQSSKQGRRQPALEPRRHAPSQSAVSND